MSRVGLSKTEWRVLHGMQLNHRAWLREPQPFEDAEVTGVLQGYESIYRAANIVRCGGRKSTTTELYNALQRLVARGLVESDVVRGMGGALALFKLAPEVTPKPETKEI